jgi:SAM-dependent methyltransferase
VPKAEWGTDPGFFGPRHAYRERRMMGLLGRRGAAAGLHLECAAGVGSFCLALARGGRKVVAADQSLRSLAVIRFQTRRASLDARVLPVVVDITALPFRDAVFASASSAETLEHVRRHEAAARELFRVVTPGGVLIGSVPAGPSQWSAWDEWAGHERRYTSAALHALLSAAGFEPVVRTWGFPMIRVYDAVFLRRVNRRRLTIGGTVESDVPLRTVAGLGRRRWLVRLVGAAFAIDRLFDGAPWGVGLFFLARRPSRRPEMTPPQITL